ncbi:MAG: ribbon-helix-helix protein, CopG family [Mesorhizobium sp.]|nr:ribbon-helix-helix protein, CopG family [Mesorhizobium sp.]
MNAASKTTELRIPARLHGMLEELARKTGRSKDYHVRKAIESYLEDVDDRELVLVAIAEGRGKETTSLEDIVAELGLEDAIYGRRRKTL